MNSEDLENNKKLIINDKRPFDKKRWREDRYSNKAKVLKWENNRKRQALRNYHKELKTLNINKLKNTRNESNSQTKTTNALKKAQLEYNRIQQLKEENRKEKERIKRQKSEALRVYHERKKLRYKKLSQKTKKGQPVMRGRIELLLEKIQKQYGN